MTEFTIIQKPRAYLYLMVLQYGQLPAAGMLSLGYNIRKKYTTDDTILTGLGNQLYSMLAPVNIDLRFLNHRQGQ